MINSFHIRWGGIVGVLSIISLYILYFINAKYIFIPTTYLLVWGTFWLGLFLAARSWINATEQLVNFKSILANLFPVMAIGIVLLQINYAALIHNIEGLQEVGLETGIQQQIEWGILDTDEKIKAFRTQIATEDQSFSITAFLFNICRGWIVGFLVCCIISALSERIFKKNV